MHPWLGVPPAQLHHLGICCILIKHWVPFSQAPWRNLGCSQHWLGRLIHRTTSRMHTVCHVDNACTLKNLLVSCSVFVCGLLILSFVFASKCPHFTHKSYVGCWPHKPVFPRNIFHCEFYYTNKRHVYPCHYYTNKSFSHYYLIVILTLHVCHDLSTDTALWKTVYTITLLSILTWSLILSIPSIPNLIATPDRFYSLSRPAVRRVLSACFFFF